MVGCGDEDGDGDDMMIWYDTGATFGKSSFE